MVIPRLHNIPLLTVVLTWLLVGAVSGQAFSDEDKEKALALIAQLDADSFADREAAVKALEKLPVDALPWLGEMVEATRPVELELRSRLKSIVRTLKRRDAEVSLREGTKTVLKLEAAKPEEFLQELEKQHGVALGGRNMNRIWDKVAPEDIEFEGSYWEAVETLIEKFPPPAGERETLSGNYRLTRWAEDDFKAGRLPSVSSGILRVRQARFSLENSGGKDSLVLTLVPSIEPRYQVEKLGILIKGMALEDGTYIEPEEKICKWELKRHGNGARYSPSAVFTWIFPLKKGVKLKGGAGIEAIADVAVRRMEWAEVDLPEELNEKVPLSSTVDLQVLERGDGRLKIQFEGSGSEPACFDDYELRGEAYKVLDADGKELEFNVNSSSSGGGRGWRNSYGGSVKGDPVRLKARLPGGEQKVQLKFDLMDLALPGSSLED